MFFARRYLFFFALFLLSLCLADARAAMPQIAAGYYHNAALKNDGTVWAWGFIGFNNIGTQSPTPVQVPGVSNAAFLRLLRPGLRAHVDLPAGQARSHAHVLSAAADRER